MPKPWKQDVLTFRCYIAKVDLWERLIITGEEQDQAERCLAESLLSLLDTVIDTDDHGCFYAHPERAEIVLPIIEEAQLLDHTQMMSNRLSVEQNVILALRSINEILPAKARKVLPIKPLTYERPVYRADYRRAG